MKLTRSDKQLSKVTFQRYLSFSQLTKVGFQLMSLNPRLYKSNISNCGPTVPKLSSTFERLIKLKTVALDGESNMAEVDVNIAELCVGNIFELEDLSADISQFS